MSITTWFMDKMMDRVVALDKQDKVEVMNGMLDKFMNDVPEEEKIFIAKELSVKFLDLITNYTSDSDKIKLLSQFMDAKMVEAYIAKILPEMLKEQMGGMGGTNPMGKPQSASPGRRPTPGRPTPGRPAPQTPKPVQKPSAPKRTTPNPINKIGDNFSF